MIQVLPSKIQSESSNNMFDFGQIPSKFEHW